MTWCQILCTMRLQCVSKILTTRLKLWLHEPDTFFLQADTEVNEKRNFFINRSVPENFRWENFSGHTPRKFLRTQDSKKKIKKEF